MLFFLFLFPVDFYTTNLVFVGIFGSGHAGWVAEDMVCSSVAVLNVREGRREKFLARCVLLDVGGVSEAKWEWRKNKRAALSGGLMDGVLP